MSGSRATDDGHRQAFLAEGETDFNWVQAEQEIAAVLGLELELDEHLGEDWVLDVDAEMLAKCQTLIASRPRLMVFNVLIAGLRGS